MSDSCRWLPTSFELKSSKGPLRRLSKWDVLRSFDLSAATDCFPLSFQGVKIKYKGWAVQFRDSLCLGVLGAWNECLSSPPRTRGAAYVCPIFYRTQPLGYLSSWPLFALSHHFVVWYCADKVYPGKKFSKYALLGDDIVIGDAAVADVYKDVINRLGVIKTEVFAL